ncbi:MAG: hypothetical protein EBT94_04475 [Alphaproteobacteria bacterium]|nr:hypothetical protein [Alphaproteobacteria bacterium]
MGLFDHVLLGFQAAFSGQMVAGLPLNILMVIGGLFFGILVGATPGLAGPMAMAIALPILISVFGYETASLLPILGFLLGIMKGATLGGAVPAILFNTPGTPDALMTTLDGYPMTKRGDAKQALKTAHFASVSGDTFSDIVLIVCAPFLAIFVETYLDLPEKSALILLSLTFIAAVMGDRMSKGLIALGAGMFVAFIGTGEGFYPRLSLGMNELSGGFPIATVVLGTLIIGEVFSAMVQARMQRETTGRIEPIKLNEGRDLTLADRVKLMPYIGPSALIGTMIGALPGIGSTLAATLGYAKGRRRHAVKKAADEPDFGSGAIQGVASTEAANSAVSGANLIPVLSLGIPGNAAAIFLILAMETVDGLNPGPGVFRVPSSGINPEMVMVFGLFTLMIVANLTNWIVGGRVMQLMSVMIRIPKQILMPTVLLITMTSIYAQEANLLALVFLLGFGVLGFVMRMTGIPVLPFVIAYILGPSFEATSRQAFASTGGDPWFLVSSPISILFMVMSAGIIIYFTYRNSRR